jgi:hypothetical protein
MSERIRAKDGYRALIKGTADYYRFQRIAKQRQQSEPVCKDDMIFYSAACAKGREILNRPRVDPKLIDQLFTFE